MERKNGRTLTFSGHRTSSFITVTEEMSASPVLAFGRHTLRGDIPRRPISERGGSGTRLTAKQNKLNLLCRASQDAPAILRTIQKLSWTLKGAWFAQHFPINVPSLPEMHFRRGSSFYQSQPPVVLIFLENESGLPRFLQRRKENKHIVHSSLLSL